MKILIEVEGGIVQHVWSFEPCEIVVRDMDNIAVGDVDPLEEAPELNALMNSKYQRY